MSGSATAELDLPAEPRTVGRARRAVKQALEKSGGTELLDVSQLVVSELVTNAVVHAGTHLRLRITAEHAAIRVEIEDGSQHLPVRRTWSGTAGTGRGLLIVDELADRWSSALTAGGKVVWFEIGRLTVPFESAPATPGSRPEDALEVTLLDVPLLMHWAWQEHAATLLREYLLYALERDPDALEQHAAASDALRILDEQLPAPLLPREPDALMASSVEPTVTADRVAVDVPLAAVGHFAVLDALLDRAVSAAQAGKLLGPPTQPEIGEMRAWLCGEVAGQARGAGPTPWRAATDVRAPLDQHAVRELVYRQLADSDEPMIATNDASVIVAATPSLVAFLGYDEEADLVGRRILVVVPTRFHQAHIAGTTLHVTNGRDVLLDRWLTVPVVRADGSEETVQLNVRPRRLDGDLPVFVARFRLPVATPPRP